MASDHADLIRGIARVWEEGKPSQHSRYRILTGTHEAPVPVEVVVIIDHAEAMGGILIGEECPPLAPKDGDTYLPYKMTPGEWECWRRTPKQRAEQRRKAR